MKFYHWPFRSHSIDEDGSESRMSASFGAYPQRVFVLFAWYYERDTEGNGGSVKDLMYGCEVCNIRDKNELVIVLFNHSYYFDFSKVVRCKESRRGLFNRLAEGVTSYDPKWEAELMKFREKERGII